MTNTTAETKTAAELVAGDQIHLEFSRDCDPVVGRVGFTRRLANNRVLVVLDTDEGETAHLKPTEVVKLATDEEQELAQRQQRAHEAATKLENVAREIRRLALPIGYRIEVSGSVVRDVAALERWAQAFGLEIEDSASIPAVHGEWSGIQIHAQAPQRWSLERALDEAFPMDERVKQIHKAADQIGAALDAERGRECAKCGETVAFLSSAELCDGCEAEIAATPVPCGDV